MGNLSNKLKSYIKTNSTFHVQGVEKNIFLFSTPRSGSTWLTELISTQPKFKYVKEPFNIRKQVVVDNLGINQWEEIINDLNKQQIQDYLNVFIEGNDKDLRYNYPVPFSSLWKPFTSRIIFKILFAGENDFNWFRDNFNGEIIYLLRHPIPVTLSREYYPRLESFMKSSFIDSFSSEQVELAKKILSEGNDFKIGIIDWCFQNALPLQKIGKDWLVISYEQTVLQPQVVVENLMRRFKFSDKEKIISRINKASVSTVKSSDESKEILLDPQKINNNRTWLVEKWKDKISIKYQKEVFEILKTFNIDFYEYGSFVANDKYILKKYE